MTRRKWTTAERKECMETNMKENLDPATRQWITLTELAARWKVCKRTITRIPAAELFYYNLPTQRRYLLGDVARYESKRFVHAQNHDGNGKED